MNTHAELFHGCCPVNWLNIRSTSFLRKTSGWLLLFDVEYVKVDLVKFYSFWKCFLQRKNTCHRQISDPKIIYDGALCGNVISGSHFPLAKELQLRWRRNRKAASVCYHLQFPWENWKHGRGENPGGLQHITYWYLIYFLGERENGLLLSLLKNGSF